MDTDKEKLLEERIGLELGKLPEWPAPGTLVPRVLAAIHAQARRPWWRRSWSAWPPKIKGLFVGALFALLGLALWGSSFLWHSAEFTGSAVRLGQWLRALLPFWETAIALINAVLILGRASLGQPWILLALAFAFGMYVVCLGLGTVCYRVALPQNFKRN